MSSDLPPQIKNQLAQLQQIQQQAQAIAAQKNQVEINMKETDLALEELENSMMMPWSTGLLATF